MYPRLVKLTPERIDAERQDVARRARINATHDVYQLARAAWGPRDTRTVTALDSYLAALNDAAERRAA